MAITRNSHTAVAEQRKRSAAVRMSGLLATVTPDHLARKKRGEEDEPQQVDHAPEAGAAFDEDELPPRHLRLARKVEEHGEEGEAEKQMRGRAGR